MTVRPVVVGQEPGHVVPTEVLAQHIVAISQSVDRLLAGPLNERALLLLIEDAAPLPERGRTRVTKAQIKAVLDGIKALERTFIRRPAPPAAGGAP